MHKSYLILRAMEWFSGKPSAINVACSVWEGGNGKGLESTSPAPYFILKPNPETGEADPDLVGILANVFNSIIYLRNLQLIRKQGLAASGSVPMGGLEKPESSVGGQPTGGR